MKEILLQKSFATDYIDYHDFFSHELHQFPQIQKDKLIS